MHPWQRPCERRHCSRRLIAHNERGACRICPKADHLGASGQGVHEYWSETGQHENMHIRVEAAADNEVRRTVYGSSGHDGNCKVLAVSKEIRDKALHVCDKAT